MCEAGEPCYDGFVSVLDHSGSELLHSTFIGGSDNDTIYDSARDSYGNIFLVGSTGSDKFSKGTTNAFDTNFNGGYRDAFVAAIRPDFE